MPSTTYYVRAYAINAAGASYSDQVTFTTDNGLPTVTTGSVSNITATSATCSGNVTSDGGFSVTTKGLCWSMTQYPTVTDSHSSNGSGTGAFNGSLTNLQVGKTYYVRAYATNSQGTSYGDQVHFNTGNGLPSVTTTAPTINGSIVSTGGNVTNDGGFPVTARGVCYGPYPNPDLTSTYSHTNNGTGTGYYTSSFPVPNGCGKYYIRAYATNAQGTTYGNQVTIQYDDFPKFTYNGHVYSVAPDPGVWMSSWSEANSYCNNLSISGVTGWRMPTQEELFKMYEERAFIGGVANDYDSWYLSSKACVNGSFEQGHIKVCFYNGGYDCRTGGGRIRPIRIVN